MTNLLKTQKPDIFCNSVNVAHLDSTYHIIVILPSDVLPSPAIAVSSTDSSDSVDVRASAAVDRTTQQFGN